MAFKFLNVWKKTKESYFMTHENDKKFRWDEVVLELGHVLSLTCHLGPRSSYSSPEDLPCGPLQESLLTLI